MGRRSVRVGVYLGEVMSATPVKVGLSLPLSVISVGVCTVEDGVAIYHEGGGRVDVGFCDGHDVDVVVLHVSYDGVDLGCLHETCGVPATQPGEVFAGDFVGLFVPVMLWWL